MMFRFADPWLLLALIAPLLLLWWLPARGGRGFAPFALAAALRPSRGPLVYRMLLAAGVAALVVAAARPQYGQTITEREQAGRDLMLVIDLSGSMQIDDLANEKGERIDRLAAVFAAAKTFIDGRPDDRIGLVFFGDKALTSCPLTYDHETVRQFLERTEQQQRGLWGNGHDEGLLGGSTNIGLGLGTALKAMRDQKSLGRAVIVITDGVDSRQLRNWVDPLTAARQAGRLDVTVYGIGVGNPQGNRTVDGGLGRRVLVPLVQELLPDLGRLQAIAELAKGTAFSADDLEALKGVFAKIDHLQPTPHTVRQRDDFTDRGFWPLLLGAIVIALTLALEPRLRGAS